MAELNYASYLHLDELLQLQHARSTPAEHDELLFIVTHQSTELWLKELLHEFDHTLFPRWPFLEQRGAEYHLPEGTPSIPLMYSLRARRAA